MDTPALLMKLGYDTIDCDPSLGQAIAHVMTQPLDEQWLFDIVTDEGLINHRRMLEIARSEAYVIWSGQSI